MNERFWSHVDASVDCWLWTGAIDKDGYGAAFAPGHVSKARAHRVAYEALVGPIPEGLVIDHLCRVKPCVNPDHMEPVTIGENVRRGMRLRAGHCKAGHRMDADNILIHFTKRGSGTRRQCRICWAGYFRKYRAQKRAARAA